MSMNEHPWLKHGGPAFPTEDKSDDFIFRGMSLRDYFAAKAMAAVVGAFMPQEGNCWSSADFAREGYEIADAMLAERAK